MKNTGIVNIILPGMRNNRIYYVLRRNAVENKTGKRHNFSTVKMTGTNWSAS